MTSSASTAPAPRLQVCNLGKTYAGRMVVQGVNLEVMPGQVTCLLGPSGCGKSTMLRMVAGVEQQDHGEIFVDGQLICGHGFRILPEHRSIGLMFQDFALFPHLNIAQNIGFGIKGNSKEIAVRVDELLERVKLSHYKNAYPHELSGGEQQRIALARALAPKPHIMLMDEPFSGLDERLRDSIRDETLEICKEYGACVLMVTHDPSEAMRMADEIALMRNGKIVQRGAPYNIFNAPVDKDAAAFFSDINTIPSTVHGALIETAFGQFLAPGFSDGQHVNIVIRPQHLKLDLDRAGQGPRPTPTEGTAALGIVQRARFMGEYSLVELKMEFDGSILKAKVPSVFLPKYGTPLWVMIRRDRCFVFASDP